LSDYVFRLVGAITLAFVVVGIATGAFVSADVETNLPEPPDGMKWELVWSDEFEGDELDDSKWEAVGDSPRRDHWWVKEDAYLDGRGNLIIRTKKDGDRYTSGAVRTAGRFSKKFGYFEARCRMPKKEGHWCAFWMMTGNVGKVGDDGRDGTEIDIMEKPTRLDRVEHALHWDGYGEHHQKGHAVTDVPGVNEGFHTFSMWWSPEEYVFYVNGKEVWRTSDGGVSQEPGHMILSTEIGEWGGDITKAHLPDHFVIDYVRVYDLVEE
jgi:beta-glucanase (GH16 family)